MRKLSSVLFLAVCIIWSMAFACQRRGKPGLLAVDIFISQAGGGAGSSCASPRALSSLVSGDWVASNNIHTCGTLTSTLTAQGSGSSGSPITIIGESGHTFSSSVWSATTGAINISSRSWINVQNVNIQNTGNSTSGTKTNSTGVYAVGCNNCTVHDSTIFNIYVRAQGDASTGINKDQLNAVNITGQNWRVYNNVFHDMGWAVLSNYSTNDAGEVDHNEFYNMDHGFAPITSNAATNTKMEFHDNKVHDFANWDAPGCGFHHDGLHTYSTNAGSTLTTLNIYNNKYYGEWGTCITGYIFVEGGGSSTPARAATVNVYNEIGLANQTTAFANTGGWFQIFSGSTAVNFYNNTAILPGTSDLASCFNIGSTTNTTIKNNLCYGAGGRTNYGNFSGTTSIDYNQYDTKTDPGGNCWIWNSSFAGCNFATWKTTCSCDSHSRQDTYPLAVNTSDGTPQATFTGIKWANNFASISTGSLASMVNDSTAGGTRTALARPAAGTCSSQGSLPCWDIGAFQYSAAAPTAPGPAPAIFSSVPLPQPPAQVVVASVSPGGSGQATLYTSSKGCTVDKGTFLNPCLFKITCTSGCSATTLVNLDGALKADGTCCTGGTAISQTYASNVVTATVPLTALGNLNAAAAHRFWLWNADAAALARRKR